VVSNEETTCVNTHQQDNTVISYGINERLERLIHKVEVDSMPVKVLAILKHHHADTSLTHFHYCCIVLQVLRTMLLKIARNNLSSVCMAA